MLTHQLSTTELALIVEALNSRPRGMSHTATLDNVATFTLGYVRECVARFAARSRSEAQLKKRLLSKLDAARTQQDDCTHRRTIEAPNGRTICRDCNYEF